MRTGTLLCSQTTEGLEPLGAFNQPVYRGYGQIRAALLNELGALYADYFARPDTELNGTSIGWLAHALGEPSRWIDLPPPEQARLQPILQRVQTGFAEYRAQLDAAPVNSPKNNFARLLAQALIVPGPEYLYFLGDQPVLAFWGFKPMKMAEGVDPLRLSAGSTILGRTVEPVARETVPPVVHDTVPPVVVVKRRRWWLWLLGLLGLLLLALLIGFWFWRSHMLEQQDALRNLIPHIIGSDHPAAPKPPVIVGDHDVAPVLRRPGVDVEPKSGIVTPGPVIVPGPTGSVTGRVVEPIVPPQDHPVTPVVPRGPGNATLQGGLPNVPPFPPLPGPPSGPGPQIPGRQPMTIPPGLPDLPPTGGSPAERGPPLSVPANAPQGAADFMQGVWRRRSGLMLGGKPAEEFYRFNKSGQGAVTLRTRDGSQECTGPVQAAVSGGRELSFTEAPELACSDGSSVTGALTECVPGPDRAICQGRNNDDGTQFGVQIEGVQGQ